MSQVIDKRVPSCEPLEAVGRALGGGAVLVDSDGAVVWMDGATRRRVDGELGRLPLPLAKPEGKAVDCFATPVELTVNGEQVSLCVLQQTEPVKKDDGQDLITALEAMMADSASWFSRTIEKLKTSRRAPSSALPGTRRPLDLLSDRECEVLGLLCEGKNSVTIGEVLGLSENTVRNHIASLYRKIGVNRRSAAVIWARERGITGRDSIAVGRTIPRRERAPARSQEPMAKRH
jgi:DNA-binding CsgD family transcriptional regulator